MKQYKVYFKNRADAAFFCDRIEIQESWTGQKNEFGSGGRIKLFKRNVNTLNMFFEIPNLSSKKDEEDIPLEEIDAFIDYEEVAAIIPVEHNPAAPGFLVYLKNWPTPLTVKASYVKAHREFISFGNTKRLLPGGQYMLDSIPDIYVAKSEVMAVIPEVVDEGEAAD